MLPKKYHGDETPTISIKAMRELEKALKLRWSVRENFKPHKDLISRVSQSPLCSQNRVVVGGDRPHHPVLGGLGGGPWGSSTPMHHVSDKYMTMLIIQHICAKLCPESINRGIQYQALIAAMHHRCHKSFTEGSFIGSGWEITREQGD